MTYMRSRTRTNRLRQLRSTFSSERGFSLLELLMVTGIIGVLSAIAIPVFAQAVTTAETKAILAEGRTVHTAFKNYYLDHNAFPASLTTMTTLEPLRASGYYKGSVGSRLQGEQVDAYGSPDDQGANQEFWLEMTLRTDPTVRILVADSDDAPLSGGNPYDGVYVFVNGVLQSQ